MNRGAGKREKARPCACRLRAATGHGRRVTGYGQTRARCDVPLEHAYRSEIPMHYFIHPSLDSILAVTRSPLPVAGSAERPHA